MKDPHNDPLRESAWRRRRTPEQDAELQAWLAGHPGEAPGVHADEALNRLLDQLPDAPVPSNFTARVLETVRRDSSRGQPRHWSWTWRAWLPRAAAAGLAVYLCIFSYQQHLVVRRAEMARSLAAVSTVAAASKPEVLQDFEAIRRLGQAPPADEELLALLK
ncbi:MAG: hypothetical protein U1F98_08705 [Verrucomicrobiota bacterium]